MWIRETFIDKYKRQKVRILILIMHMLLASCKIGTREGAGIAFALLKKEKKNGRNIFNIYEVKDSL